MANAALELAAIEAVVCDDRRDRLLSFVGKPKRRSDLLSAFHTSAVLAPDVLVPLPPECTDGAREVALLALLEHMSRLGAGGDCYAMSLLSNLDGRTLHLAEGLEACFMNTVETLLFDPVSRLGYFEGGHSLDRWIVRARRSAL